MSSLRSAALSALLLVSTSALQFSTPRKATTLRSAPVETAEAVAEPEAPAVEMLESAAPPPAPPAPPAPKARIANKKTEDWFDLALPWMDRPKMLDRDLAADQGFDPFGLADSKVSLYSFREAEVKHARLAMLAAAGWPLAELWDTSLANVLGLRPIIEENAGRSPSVLNGGLGMVSPVYWAGVLAFAAGIETVSELRKTRAKAADSQWMLTGSYVPGDLGFDPLGAYTLFGRTEGAKLTMETAELKNGRLAMVAIVAYVGAEYLTGKPVVELTPFFFDPFWKTVENLMFNAPPLYTQ